VIFNLWVQFRQIFKGSQPAGYFKTSQANFKPFEVFNPLQGYPLFFGLLSKFGLKMAFIQIGCLFRAKTRFLS
jgi:hypothetical protein